MVGDEKMAELAGSAILPGPAGVATTIALDSTGSDMPCCDIAADSIWSFFSCESIDGGIGLD